MTGRTLAAVAGIALVLWYLVKRYTSDPFAAPVLAFAPAPAPNPPIIGLAAGDKVKPIGQPQFPYTDVASGVPNIESPAVWSSEPLPAPLPASPDEYDSAWRAEQPEAV